MTTTLYCDLRRYHYNHLTMTIKTNDGIRYWILNNTHFIILWWMRLSMCALSAFPFHVNVNLYCHFCTGCTVCGLFAAWNTRKCAHTRHSIAAVNSIIHIGRRDFNNQRSHISSAFDEAIRARRASRQYIMDRRVVAWGFFGSFLVWFMLDELFLCSLTRGLTQIAVSAANWTNRIFDIQCE